MTDPMKGLRRSRPIQLLRRVWIHVSRRTAVLSLLGILVAIGNVALFGADAILGQISLVVIGTLFSFALLPDEPVRIWNVNAQALADTVPRTKLALAGREVVGAVAIQAGGLVPIETMSELWESNLRDLEDVAENPAAVARNLDYRVTVTPSDAGVTVDAHISAMRFLPGLDEVNVSFCSNLVALKSEFTRASGSGCLLRELVVRRVLETPMQWQERVQAYHVSLVADGRRLPLRRIEQVSAGDGDSSIVRFVHDAGTISDRFTNVRISATFENPDTGEFGVKFSSYYCVGSTNVVFDFRDSRRHLDFNEFLSNVDRPIDAQSYRLADGAQRIAIATTDSAVIPAGSGVVFEWKEESPQLLFNDRLIRLEEVPEGKNLPIAKPIPSVRRPSRQATEQLVDVEGLQVLDAYAALGILPARHQRLREGVLERLLAANALLPSGYKIVVLDSWRSRSDQQALIDHYDEGVVEGQFVASLNDDGIRPPHVTGAAVDITLAKDGVPIALGTDYDSFAVAAHLNAYEGIDGVTRRLRRMLAEAMLSSEFAPYPIEWWHWSYGDDVWAEFYDREQAIYDEIEG